MGARTWTDEHLKEAVVTSKTFSEVARKLGLLTYGTNTKTIKKYIAKLNLSTQHFLSVKEQLQEARKLLKSKSHDQIFCQNNMDRKYIKSVIIKYNLIEYKCEQCHIHEWLGTRLSLHLDHKNGINNDNRLENLRFLCPNCHSLTDTYCGKSLTGINRKLKTRCQDCNQEIYRNSSRCKSCVAKNRKTKILWPNIDDLNLLISELGYTGAAKRLGVSANGIKKRIRKLSAENQPGIEPR